MLQTNLQHIESGSQLETILQENENVMVCCGRMGPMCVPVYAAMKDLEGEYQNIKFYDMEFDLPDASLIRNLPECRGFMGLPFTVYYRDGKVVKATSSIQSKDQIREILDAKLNGK
ncbi:MAG: thioredoxin family protein [Bacteroidetes bacterium]|nr:thioredoxin family protein [Bacteroidota bacterium]